MKFKKIPIKKDYLPPSEEELDFLNHYSQMVAIDDRYASFILENYYMMKGYAGSNINMYAREALLKKLEFGLKFLEPNYTLVLFDAFRGRATQLSLYNDFYSQIKIRNPHLSDKLLHEETKKFVAHPDDRGRFPVAPHNSGGAIDLSIRYGEQTLDMGTEFDDLTDLAQSNYFEQNFIEGIGFTRERWLEVRANRRLLFNLMKVLGFTNYEYEWWHFDLGNCLWGSALNTPWIFKSAEEEVKRLCAESTTLAQ
ncbi:MAG: D-Ala-D-Ala dipeptidase [Oligoflexia bacterium]|nr:D-Ala-D-Ala dipeptidase [Oligoflexia bacterium]MBF0367001.1 D-Ala-D-Ala dipeptidase [Oligoflexia bacterium]